MLLDNTQESQRRLARRLLFITSHLSGGGNGNNALPDLREEGEGPSGDPEPEDSQPWWKIKVTKDDLVTYGMAIAISYGIRE